jgi:hypothetical protein
VVDAARLIVPAERMRLLGLMCLLTAGVLLLAFAFGAR